MVAWRLWVASVAAVIGGLFGVLPILAGELLLTVGGLLFVGGLLVVGELLMAGGLLLVVGGLLTAGGLLLVVSEALIGGLVVGVLRGWGTWKAWRRSTWSQGCVNSKMLCPNTSTLERHCQSTNHQINFSFLSY